MRGRLFGVRARFDGGARAAQGNGQPPPPPPFSTSPTLARMPQPARMPRWMPALRNRRAPLARQAHTASAAPAPPSASFRKRDLLLRGPQLLLRGPGLLLQAPKVVWRAPSAARAGTRRLLSTTIRRNREQRPVDHGIEQPQPGPSKRPYDEHPGQQQQQHEGQAHGQPESFACALSLPVVSATGGEPAS